MLNRSQYCLLSTHDRDQLIFAPFIHLPSRTLTDYYRIIKRPVSLKSAQKLVRGIKGRDPPTGSTFLKSWQAFEDEVSYIWKNARTYNEDGSAISELAGELEVFDTISCIRFAMFHANPSFRITSTVVWQRRSVLLPSPHSLE